ncbi:hypothetical protein METBIDRAFT_24197, partial [Metschnikowia bicuspidata var. bicuspidata NRRL YB-4993]
ILSAIALAQAAYLPSEPWTTLTPSATYPGATTDHFHSFGIQVVSITTASSEAASSSTAAVAKRGVINQIGDGQIQNQSSETLSTPTITTASVINQISDGQIQAQTTTTSSTSTSSSKITTASVINQISDGQIQDQTTTSTTSSSSSMKTTASVINQISDGQIQDQTTSASTSTNTAAVASQISDGQVQATDSVFKEETDGFSVSCSTSNSLMMVLQNGELKDSNGRIGAIVANRQFQFDGPPPQAGTIYAAGWSVTEDHYLALGDSDVFYLCVSGDFSNLYDENVAAQCSPVHLEVINFVSC